MDGLNTHHGGGSYHRSEPAIARALAERVEFVDTPRHGSRLNMAEIELSVLARQCLSRRSGEWPTLEREIAAWAARRNATQAGETPPRPQCNGSSPRTTPASS